MLLQLERIAVWNQMSTFLESLDESVKIGIKSFAVAHVNLMLVD